MREINDDTSVTLYETENFTIHPCTYQTEDDGAANDGYSIVFKGDGNVQARGPAWAVAVGTCYQWEQQLQYAKAYKTAEAMEGGENGLDFSGMLAGEVPGDTKLN